ncbi:MAG: hypothetical protein VW405_02555 [Rhodospirillaceae bacterium]
MTAVRRQSIRGLGAAQVAAMLVLNHWRFAMTPRQIATLSGSPEAGIRKALMNLDGRGMAAIETEGDDGNRWHLTADGKAVADWFRVLAVGGSVE